MKQDGLNDLKECVSDILLPNGSFYRKSPEEESLYLVDAVEIGTLAYQIIQFAANVFGAALPLIAGSHWLYRKYFPNKKNLLPHVSDSNEEQMLRMQQQADLEAKLDQLQRNVKDPHICLQLSEDITKILEYHGWPADQARVDADHVVTALVDKKNAQAE